MAPNTGGHGEDLEEVGQSSNQAVPQSSTAAEQQGSYSQGGRSDEQGQAAAQQSRGLPSLPPRSGARGLPSLPPKGLGGGLQTRSQPAESSSSSAEASGSASSSAAAAPASSTAAAGLPKLPARPAGGLGGLPARPGSSAPSAQGAGASSSTAQPPAAAASSPPAPAASTPSTGPAAPSSTAAPRPSMPSLPARPQPSAAAAQPAAAAPALPARPAGLGAGGAGGAGTRPPFPGLPGQRPPAAPAPAAAAAVAAAPQPSQEVVDPSEDRKAQRLQRKVQDMRVNLIRAAGRLGLRFDSDQVTQFLQVINRVETMAGANVYKGVRRVDLTRAAEREARDLDSREAADSPLNVRIKVLLIGMTGTGKSELINAMLERPAARTSAFSDATKSIRVHRGSFHGIQVEFIDTPGLHAAAAYQAENKALLKKIKRAYAWQKPNYVFYVDRLDAARPGLGELSLLGLINETFGAKIWRETMVVLTHAHACRQAMGAQYDTFTRQRRNIMLQLLRQAAGDMQVRNPVHIVDCHPNCPTNSFGQPVVLDGATNVPWKQALYMQLVGYRVYEEVQNLFKDKAKAKAAAKQADLFKQMMRARLPPVSFFVEQMSEGVLKPETWGAMDDPFDQETDQEDAEEFNHMYYQLMYKLARNGNPWAQKEYALMLKRLDKLRKTYREAFQNEDIEMMANAGYEGYVAEGLDLGPTFDPEDVTNHRYCYVVPESEWQVMPTLDYYGYEHEDAITGFVAEYDAQLFNRDGWGGFPMDLHLAVEKDKTTTCLQGESHVSIVHAVEPFANRHITQLTGSFELLRPNLKDVLYQLEVNTFKDGFLLKKDHAGFGIMMARLGEGGNINKGPVGVGLRVQDSFRLGAFKVDACASKVTCETATGGKDEGWGGRAFVHYDWLPGLGMVFDFWQKRTPENQDVRISGIASNFTYDWQMFGSACSVEVDHVIGSNKMHVDMNLFNGYNYSLAWLLVIPAWNYVKGMWQRIRSGAPDGEVVEEEGEEGLDNIVEEGDEDGQYEEDV